MFPPQDAKVMSWWDYGYQITAMANRTILVDNNTWNNTHISRVGQVNAAPASFIWNQVLSWNECIYWCVLTWCVCVCVGDGLLRGEGL